MPWQITPVHAERSCAKHSVNPFQHDAGMPPACLAGRDHEKIHIEDAVVSITQWRWPGAQGMAHHPAGPLKITGPAGYGKTALLSHAALLARRRGVHVVRLSRLHDLSRPASEKAVAGAIEGPGFDWRVFWLSLLYEGSLKFVLRTGGSSKPLEQALREKVARTPVMFVLDDAQDCDIDALEFLHSAVVGLMNQKRPVALLVAGRTALDDLLRSNHLGTSWNLMPPLKPLSGKEASEALRKPLQDFGYQVEDEALELMAEHAGRHPRFVQVVGSSVWKTARDEQRRDIDRFLVERASWRIQAHKEVVYYNYCTGIKRKNLAAFARDAARIMEANGSCMTEGGLAKAMSADCPAVDEQEIRNKIDALLKVDFFRYNREFQLEPGIPLLFDYIKRMM